MLLLLLLPPPLLLMTVRHALPDASWECRTATCLHHVSAAAMAGICLRARRTSEEAVEHGAWAPNYCRKELPAGIVAGATDAAEWSLAKPARAYKGALSRRCTNGMKRVRAAAACVAHNAGMANCRFAHRQTHSSGRLVSRYNSRTNPL